MSNEQAASETKGVTAELLATVDLGPEIEGMGGRQLRMRMVTIESGGVFGPIHDHKDRPGIVYILQGTITDHRNGVATDYGPRVGWPEDKNTTHWLENRGAMPAVEISEHARVVAGLVALVGDEVEHLFDRTRDHDLSLDVRHRQRPVQTCLGTLALRLKTNRIALCPKSAVGPNMQGQPPSITVIPCSRPYAVAVSETLPAPGPRCISPRAAAR